MKRAVGFESALKSAMVQPRKVGGAVRLWRRACNSKDQAAFDAAVDDRAGVSVQQLLRAVNAAGGRAVSYQALRFYREAVREGAQR